MSHTIVVYTDGSALGNPGPAGYAFLIWNKKDNTVKEFGGASSHATNNQMELTAFKCALAELIKTLPDRNDIVIHLDSEYVKNGITSWVNNWKKNGWRTAAKKPVLNKEIWEEIDALYEKIKTLHKIELKYVPGHAGFAGNEVVDTIARSLAAGEKYKMFSGKKEEFENLRKVKM